MEIVSKARIKCLAIEDEFICQYILKKHVEDLDCDIDVAEDAESARSLLAANDYNIIFMDIGLPGTSGVELTKEIRQDLSVTCPIVAVTGQALIQDRLNFLKAGMDAVLHKPVSKQQLKQEINSLALQQDCVGS